MGSKTWKKVSFRRAFSVLCCWFFSSVFFPGSYWSVSYAETATPAPSPSLRGELEKLAEISMRLAALNETLSSELNDSRKSSEELARSLENSKRELSALRNELESSRAISNELALSAEKSETESLELKAALTKAESSLRNLEVSFAAYRKEAETRIEHLERSFSFTRFLAAIASIFAVSGWAAFFALLVF